ncbi:MAG: HAMP domain-containing protein [Zoogloeaceae bacterium]|jgi:nitrogen fixation/metabolism regulation signal transduction histidine kinase|nr:HAMP domain-containing protein [Zoogloeaceae bacterium]
MRWLLIIALGLAGVLLFLLTSASAKTALFTDDYRLLLGFTAAIAALLLGLVLWQLRQLWREHRAEVFGSRLKLRLMLMFALMAVVPGALVYAVSLQFAVKSIESWFDLRVDKALEGGLNLGRNALDYLLADLTEKATVMALDLGEAPTMLSTQLNRLREQAGVQSVTLFSAAGQVVASSAGEHAALLPDLPSPAQLRQARQGSGVSAVEGEAESGLTLRVLVPVAAFRFTGETRVLQLTQAVPSAIAASAESVQAAYRDYQELSLAKGSLKTMYTLTLTLALLLSLFAAIALAFLLARRLSAPLSILARGTEAVATGDYSPRETVSTRDELGVLTRSFSQMTQQLSEARVQAERSRAETETARAYLESVLGNLSAGVLAFDAGSRLRAANDGARAILNDDLADAQGAPLAAWQRHGELRDAIVAGDAERAGEWQREIEMQTGAGAPQALLVRGARLPAASGGGWVVVFDDITQLIAAQRSAAWGEVARRLAHEIKNPLTPIQLSAERLQHKLTHTLSGSDREMLERATQTIVNQVAAMKHMVNDFRDYARLPPPKLGPLDLNALVEEVLGLYEASHARLRVELAGNLLPVSGDATQLRQVIHNLIANAEDALAGAAEPEIVIATRAEARGAVFSVNDNGSGFPKEILARVFEPYVTTKAKGTGLGLAIVKKIVDEHHGQIEISNAAPHGAQVKIRLPLAA